jgi:DNA-binding XRE family transcriptional regulator
MYRTSQRIEGLREARRRAGLTQQQLADLAHLPRQHVSAIERHNLLLTEDRARKFAPHLRTHPAALVVNHAAVPILRGANKASLTMDDFKALVRAFSATRAQVVASPGLRLELIAVVREMSETLFSVWRRLLDDAERDAGRTPEARPG